MRDTLLSARLLTNQIGVGGRSVAGAGLVRGLPTLQHPWAVLRSREEEASQAKRW